MKEIYKHINTFTADLYLSDLELLLRVVQSHLVHVITSLTANN